MRVGESQRSVFVLVMLVLWLAMTGYATARISRVPVDVPLRGLDRASDTRMARAAVFSGHTIGRPSQAAILQSVTAIVEEPASFASHWNDSYPYAGIIREIAARQGVDPMLIRAMIEVESAFLPHVTSPQGAMGLMQITPQIAARYAVRNPYDPTANIEAGIKHLKWLMSRFELATALAAYNAGDSAVVRFGGIPPYPETRTFVNQVLRLTERRNR